MRKPTFAVAIVLTGSLFFVLRTYFFSSILHAATACTASVDTHTVTTYSETNYIFTVENTGDNTIRWIRLTRPSTNFHMDQTVTLDGYNLMQGQSINFNWYATTGGDEASSADWGIEVSDDSGGAGAISCTGDLGTAIEGQGTDTFSPTMSNITISDVDSSSATISWTTDEPADSTVEYGLTNSYGSTESDATLSSSHSITLDGLTANSTYYFLVTTTDAAGNESQVDSSFNTAKEGQTVTVTVTVTKTTTSEVTTVVTATPSPTPLPDKIPPAIRVTTDLSKPFEKAPEIRGKVTDSSGIESISYSIDDGKNWISIDETFRRGEKSVNFAFRPGRLSDGNYQLRIKAVDINANGNTTNAETLIIDRLPPRVGGSLFALGSQILRPGRSNNITIPRGIPTSLYLSAVGGPTDIVVTGNGNDIPLAQNSETGLWSNTITFDNPGTSMLYTHAKDGAGNSTDRAIGLVSVVAGGLVTYNNSPLANAMVAVYVLDPQSNRFVLWNATPFGQLNPQKTSRNGEYNLLLPTGKYYIDVHAPGMRNAATEIFDLRKASVISSHFELTKAVGISLGPITIPFFDFKKQNLPFTVAEESETEYKHSLIDKELPYFELGGINSYALHGKPTIVTVLSLWHPDTSSQLSILEELSHHEGINSVVIMTENSTGSVSVFAKRGNYQNHIIADPDGELVETLSLPTFPTHYFLNRKGVVTKVVTGILSKEEIVDSL